MAEVQLLNATKLVAHLSYSGDTWSNSIIVHKIAGGTLAGTEQVVGDWADWCLSTCPNAGFLETITGYEVFQTHIGETNVEHPPVFQNTYHTGGSHDAHYNGSPIGAALPKDVCVFAKFATSGGRSGKLFIRNLLEESDVDSAVSGQWEFSAGSTRFTVARFATNVTTFLSPDFVGGANASTAVIVVAHLLHTKATDTRAPFMTPVTGLTAVRPVWNRARR